MDHPVDKLSRDIDHWVYQADQPVIWIGNETHLASTSLALYLHSLGYRMVSTDQDSS